MHHIVSIRNRILLVLALLAVSGLGLVYWIDQKAKETFAVVLNAERESMIAAIQHMLEAEGKPLKTFVTDYALWHDMTSFSERSDSVWIQDHLVPAMDMFSLDMVAVLDGAGRPAYVRWRNGDDTLRQDSTWLAPMRSATIPLQFTHAFLWLGESVLDVRLAPIHGGADPATGDNAPTGYLVAGRLVGQEKFRNLGALLGDRLTFRSLYGAAEAAAFLPTDQAERQLLANLALGGPDGRPAAVAVFGITSPLVAATREARSSIWWRLLGFSLFSFAAMAAAITFWVARPITRMTAALQDGSPETIEDLAVGTSDIGAIALSIRNSLSDQQALRAKQTSLEASERRYQLLLNTVQEGICLIDSECFLYYCNPAFAKQLGVDHENDLLGRSLLEFVIPDYHTTITEQLAVGEDAEQLQGEIEFVTPAGRRRTLLCTIDPFVDTEMHFTGAIAATLDVTARSRAELALKDSESRLRSLTDSAQDGIVMMDSQGLTTFWNPAAERIFGYSQEEAFGRDLHQLMSPDKSQDRFFGDLPQFLRTGQAAVVNRTLNFDARRKDGREISVQVSFSPVNVNEQLSAIGIVRDVTQMRALEQERELLAAAVNSADEIIVVTDTMGTIHYANPAFERSTGFSLATAIGARVSMVKSGVHPESFYRDLWTTIMAGKSWHGRFRNKRKDGSLYDEEATISPLFAPDGSIRHFVAVKRDITQELILERQLQQKQKLEALGTFAGGIAHDFNNMLTAIIGLSSLMVSKPSEKDSVVAFATEIISTSQRAAELTRRLLAYSRDQVIASATLDLNTIMRDTFGMLRRMLRDDIVLELRLDPATGTIQADRSQLEQVIMNLVVNARDAVSERGRILLSTGRRQAVQWPPSGEGSVTPHDLIVIQCTDNGRGIPPDVIGRIFDPFFTTKDVGKGTGLGLSTVFGIVKKLGGEISVDSKVGEGTTFTIVLPALSNDTVEAGGGAAPAPMTQT